SVTALIIIYKIYNKLILSNVSGDLALVEGVDSKKYNLFYLLLIALVVSIGVKVTGSLLVGALVIIPAAAAKNLSANLRQYSLGSLILGGLSCSLGIIISEWTNALAGPVIILVSASFFLISLIIRGLRGQKMRNY
ncbi:ABC transporter, partial [archaeon CG07_land_8_20_14_0_80_38_8]